jgi:hypothetical protein
MTRRDLLALAPVLLLSGCSSEPPKKEEPEKPAEPVTGLHALFQLRAMAVAWAPDLQILHYTSINLPEVKHENGKVAAWQAVFVSPALKQSRTYTFSVYEESATLHKGLFPESPQAWSGEGKPFGIESVRVDTDKAWEVALAHGKEFAAKNPDMPILYMLGLDRGAEPDWRVIWGRSAGTSEFSVLVNATTGEFMQVAH